MDIQQTIVRVGEAIVWALIGTGCLIVGALAKIDGRLDIFALSFTFGIILCSWSLIIIYRLKYIDLEEATKSPSGISEPSPEKHPVL